MSQKGAGCGHPAIVMQWQECANSGHPPMAWRTGQIDPKHAFKIGFWTGEKGEKPVVGATGTI
jgi:hypothetical protein